MSKTKTDKELADLYRDMQAKAKERQRRNRESKRISGYTQISAWVPAELAEELKLWLKFAVSENAALCKSILKSDGKTQTWTVISEIFAGDVKKTMKEKGE